MIDTRIEIIGQLNTLNDVLGEICCSEIYTKLVEPKVENKTLIFPKTIKLIVERGKLIL